jgi:two-component system, cell cycle response regulator
MKMAWFRQSSLRNRFLLGVGVMLLPLVVLALVAVFTLQGAIAAIDDVVEEASKELAVVLRLHIQVQRASLFLHDYMVGGHGHPEAREHFLQVSQEMDRSFRNAARAPFGLGEERASIQAAQEEWQRTKATAESILSAPSRLGQAAATQAMDRLDAHIDRVLELLDRIQVLAQQEMNDQLARAHGVRRQVLLAIVTVFALGLGAAILVGTHLTRSVLLPLSAIEQGADRIGAGDLSHRISMASRDELGRLGHTFNVMAERLAKSQSALEELSTHDPLTSLPNYRVFHRRLAEEEERSRRYGRPFSLLMLDIDLFKTVNDTYGHLAGDEALRALSAIILRAVRPIDLVARYGGEEFAIILPETTSVGALATAERIREIIATKAIPLPSGQTVNLTVSIGVASYPEDAESGEKLTGAADQALYVAKFGGRNRVCCSGGP